MSVPTPHAEARPRDVATLLEALPYIREFHGRTVVIKYGGAAMTDTALREEFARDVVLLKYVGMNPIVVHGGGPDITHYMERLGMKVEFVEGRRVSDEATVEVVKMVLVGKQNKDIVLRLGRHGQAAIGLCGDDGSLFRVRKAEVGDRDLGFVGDIERVDVDVLNHVAVDYIPVIASVGADVEGWLSAPPDPSTLVSQTSVEELDGNLASISGGMRPKLEACRDAVRAGVESAHIIDGRVPHSLLLELFTDEGIGTKVCP